MSRHEQDLKQAKEEEEEERKARIAAPRKPKVPTLPGMKSVAAPLAEAWTEGIKNMAKGDYSFAHCVNKEITGEFENGLENLSDLKGKLTDTACYVVWAPEPKKLLFILWTPECGAKVKAREIKMVLTTYKPSVVDQLKKMLL